MSDHQWLVLVIGACVMCGMAFGYVLRRLEEGQQKRAEFEARRWFGERRLVLLSPSAPPVTPLLARRRATDTPPEAA